VHIFFSIFNFEFVLLQHRIWLTTYIKLNIVSMKKFKICLLISFIALSLPSCTFLSLLQPVSEDIKNQEALAARLRENVTAHSKEYVGIRYRYAGRSPSTGFDCSGFTSYIYSQYGVKLSASSDEQSKQGIAISLAYVKAGDLVFFGRNDNINHVAMVVSNTAEGITVIHSTSSSGVAIQNISKSKYWKPKILFARDVVSIN
jgi:hypothetical protein